MPVIDEDPPVSFPPIKGRRKEGLRKPQLRILALLASRLKGWLSEDTICEEAPVDAAWLSDNLFGRIDESLRAGVEAKNGYPSLLTLGYVTMQQVDVDGRNERVWQITPAGKEALKH